MLQACTFCCIGVRLCCLSLILCLCVRALPKAHDCAASPYHCIHVCVLGAAQRVIIPVGAFIRNIACFALDCIGSHCPSSGMCPFISVLLAVLSTFLPPFAIMRMCRGVGCSALMTLSPLAMRFLCTALYDTRFCCNGVLHESASLEAKSGNLMALCSISEGNFSRGFFVAGEVLCTCHVSLRRALARRGGVLCTRLLCSGHRPCQSHFVADCFARAFRHLQRERKALAWTCINRNQ